MDGKPGTHGPGLGANCSLDVDFLNKLGVFLDKSETQFWLFAHQLINEACCFPAFDFVIIGMITGNGDTDQGPISLGHRRFFQLCRWHLTKTLKSRDIDFTTALKLGFHEFFAVCIIAGKNRFAAL